MLKNLSLKFTVKGTGAEALKKIKSSYKELEEKLKNPLKINLKNAIKNPFSKIEVFSSNLITKGYQIAGVFKKSFIGIQNVGAKAFTYIGKSFDRLMNKFRLTRSIRRGFQSFSAYSTKVFNKANKEAGKLKNTISRIIGALGAGLTVKTAFEGASSMEQYRNTMETILKNPIQAQKKLAWSSRFANKTPFETGEVVEAMTRMQSYGMEGDRLLKTTGRTYMEMIGDMASAMNKPLEQAVEALADSRTGELERLKEFGITKNMIGDFARAQGYGEMFNNKGQIKDLNMFNRALFELMNSKFGGAMEKQARTFKGAMSTIKGVFKSGLSTLAGIVEFGNVIENSPFQVIRDKVLIPLADKLVKWQSDGTFTKWAEKLATGMEKIINIGSKFINFCIKWKEVLIPLGTAFTGLFVIKKVAFLIGALKVALSGLSFNPVMAGIGLAIAGAVALYRNWDKVKAVFKGAFDTFMGVIGAIKEGISNLFSSISKYTGIFNILMPSKLIFDGIKAFWGAWDSNLSIIENLKNSFGNFFSSIKDGIKSAIDGFKNLGKKISELSPIKKVKQFFNNDKNTEDDGINDKEKAKDKTKSIEEIENNSESIDGTHRNGLSYVPRDNYVARLHEGERVLTKGENKEYSKGKKDGNTYILNLTVNNNGKEIDLNKLGNFIIKKIKEFEEEKEIAEGLI